MSSAKRYTVGLAIELQNASYHAKCGRGSITPKMADEAATLIEAQQQRISDLEGGGKALVEATAYYRHMHDTRGGGDLQTGRAWDLMRRASDALSSLLKGPTS